MNYEIIDKVSRFVKRLGMVQDTETIAKANSEAAKYDFRKISEGYYAVQHTDKMYVIIERDGEIGCSCDDFTFNRKDGSCCKHIIAFSKLLSTPTNPIDDADRGFLVNMGWTGKELHPEVELGGPGAVIQEDPRPAPNPPETRRQCQYCKLGHVASSPEEADAWIKEHEASCPKNPANVEMEEPEKLMTGECQFCGKKFQRKFAKDLQDDVVAHETTCSKRPAPEEPEPEQTTAVSTGTDFPGEREFTTARVEKYVQNRGGFYKAAGGQEVPDSAAMSIYALDKCKISTETIVIEKDADQAKAIVRGYRGGVSVDASVILRFDVLRRRELLKMAKKYPKAILEWTDQMMPVMDLNYKLTDRTPLITLGEHMINFAIDQEQFSERTAETLARRRVFDMLSGVDWRSDAETQVEDDDASLDS